MAKVEFCRFLGSPDDTLPQYPECPYARIDDDTFFGMSPDEKYNIVMCEWDANEVLCCVTRHRPPRGCPYV